MNVAPVGVLVKVVVGTVFPLHAVKSGLGFTLGRGLIVIVNVLIFPTQLANVGVTVIVEVVVDETFGATKVGRFPEPDAARPIAVFVFVQSKVAPVGKLVKVVSGILLFAH